ncbi:hypothetical protein HDU67_004360, partial [Dinochytrium kinnereticum]
MRNILNRLISTGEFEAIIFGDKVILDEEVENWPTCDFLISFFSTGFPLEKAIRYTNLRKPFCINDLAMQQVLMDRRLVLRILDAINVPTPKRLISAHPSNPAPELSKEVIDDVFRRSGTDVSREAFSHNIGEVSMVDDDTLISQPGGDLLKKPFVEKPVSGEDHNIRIYFPTSQGGGMRRLFRKVGNKSSEFCANANSIRDDGSYVYEEFMFVDNAEDVKVYTIGEGFAHAETRKSPVVDGIVRRNSEGKEIRYITALSDEEKEISRRVCRAFGQTVCGFDLLRANGKSYVIDVNGWSFVKGNDEYYDKCAQILRTLFLECAKKRRRTPPVRSIESHWRLKAFLSVLRHGDRTPKQKAKFNFKSKPFMDLLQSDEEVVLKNDNIQRVVVACNEAVRLQLEESAPLQSLRAILDLKADLPGTKIQVKPSFNKIDKSLQKVQLIVKWGGEFTHGGKHQSKDLGENLRKDLRIINKALLEDVKVYSSSERRVIATADIFVKAFLDIPQIPDTLMTVSKEMLDDSNAAKEQMEAVKTKLQAILNPNEPIKLPEYYIPEDIDDPEAFLQEIIDLLSKIRGVMQMNLEEGDEIFSVQDRWCCAESPYLFKERWEKIFKEFCDVDRSAFEPSKISELYDSLKYDLLHNREFCEAIFASPEFGRDLLKQLYGKAKTLFDFIAPQEYGIEPSEKLEIGMLNSMSLLRQIVEDLKKGRDSDSPCTRLYFTKESKVISLLNIVLLCGLPTKVKNHEIDELDYLTQITFELHERNSAAGQEYSLRIGFSPGAHDPNLIDQTLDGRHSLSVAPRRWISEHISFDEALVRTNQVSHAQMSSKATFAIKVGQLIQNKSWSPDDLHAACEELISMAKALPIEEFDVRVMLDDLGVQLWNETCQRKHQGGTSLEIAEIRSLSYMLIETALHTSTELRCVNKLLDLSTRVGKAWLKAKKFEKADELFQKALTLSENLCFKETPNLKAVCLLQSYRAQMLWEKSKSKIAFQLFNKTRSKWSTSIGYVEADMICQVCLDCAKSSVDTADAVDWLKCGLEFIETVNAANLRGRKNEILLLLAHSLLKLGKLDMVDNTLSILLECTTGSFLLEAFLIKFSLLKQRKDDYRSYSDALNLMKNRVNVKALEKKSLDEEFFEALCLAKISFLASPDMINDTKTLNLIKGVVTDCVKMNFSKESTHIAQMTVWRSGDKAFEENRLEEAISWFKIALQLSADDLQDVKSASDIRRKIIMAHLDLGQVEEARNNLMSMMTDDKNIYFQIVTVESEPDNIRTAYLQFLIAVEEDDLISAEQSLSKFQANQNGSDVDLALDLLLNATDRVFKRGKKLMLQLVLRTILVSIEMLDVKQEKTMFSGLIFTLRVYTTLLYETEMLRKKTEDRMPLIASIETGLAELRSILTCPSSEADHVYMLMQSLCFEYELILHKFEMGMINIKEVGERIVGCLKHAESLDAPVEIFKQLTDITMRMQTPSSVVFVTVQATLEAMLKKDMQFDLTVFSHWFRILIKSSLMNSRDISLFRQAHTIVKANGMPTTYPQEEILWLQISAWNVGCEYFSADDRNNARLWCEMALSFSEFLPSDLPSLLEMQRSYGEILETFSDRVTVMSTPSSKGTPLIQGKKSAAEGQWKAHNPDLLPQSTWIQQEAFLPRLNQDTGPARAISATYFSHMENLLEQMDRMRSMMKEKEVDYLKIRHENIVLKQIERRQQKEIQQLDSQNQDAPKVIKGLREEVIGLKQKIKGYFAQLNVDARQIRSLNDECRKLRDHGQRLESLVSSKELLEREELSKQILESSRKLMEQEKVAAEAIRRSEMIEKNVSTENRQLRGKIHNYEKENSFLKEKNSALEELMKDKDKEIASLSIYRYNAIHRKLETSCKKCDQRSREESELRRRQAIMDPKSEPSHESKSQTVGQPEETSDAREGISTALKPSNPAAVTRSCKVTGLVSGLLYYFQIYATIDDVDGPPSEISSILVDELPSSPPKPSVVVSTNPPLIILQIQSSDPVRGSKPLRFQVYHGNDPDLKESFLIGEVDTTAIQSHSMEGKTEEEEGEGGKEKNKEQEWDGKTFYYRYLNPQTAVPHYFKVAAVNSMGIGGFSEISACAMIDIPPPKPTHPQLKKISSSSVMILSTCADNQGSDIECWRILYTKADRKSLTALNPSATTTIFTTPVGVGSGTLEFMIEGLEPGSAYVFAVAAINASGESEHSEFSEEVVLDEMIPIAEPPQIHILSPTSVKVIPDRSNLSNTVGPKVVAYKIHVTTMDTADSKPHTVVIRRNIDEVESIVDRLDAASNYWFRVCLVGEVGPNGSE